MISIYNSFDEVSFDKNTCATVGVFDGVHPGHIIILNKLVETGKKFNMRNCVITFDPHPQTVLSREGKQPIKILTSKNERISLFEKIGIENCIVVEFNRDFANISAEEFVKEMLVKKLGLSKFIIGYDHLFGKNREGNAIILSELAKIYKFEIEQIDAFKLNSTIVSSTKIRQALIDSDVESAANMLNYDYFVNGQVVEGFKRGRTIGYPTANIESEDPYKLLPGFGVYLVYATIQDKKYYGMANIGIRPTFADGNKPTLEVHFFDFKGDIYGEMISIHFLKFIRKEQKFEKIESLIAQLQKDSLQCREIIVNMK